MELYPFKADNLSMKRIFLFLLLFIFCVVNGLGAYNLTYAEQLLELYHTQLYRYPVNLAENVVWIEQSLKADFANPLNAHAIIKSPEEWTRYRYLFRMHLYLLLVESYIDWAAKYTKRKAYFYNYPWKEENLKSLDTAEDLFNIALFYWEQAKIWSKKAWQYFYYNLEEIQYWEDRNHRIETGDLDYADIIGEHLQRLENVRAKFKKMDDKTY